MGNPRGVNLICLFTNCRIVRTKLESVKYALAAAWALPALSLLTAQVCIISKGRHVMNGKISSLLSLFCASFFAVPTFAQCKNQQDRACWSLQYILYAAETDFREFRGSTPLKPRDPKLTPPNPDLSVGAIHVPCHTDFWLSSEAPRRFQPRKWRSGTPRQ